MEQKHVLIADIHLNNNVMFINDHIIAVDDKKYTTENWGTGYNDGVYNAHKSNNSIGNKW